MQIGIDKNKYCKKMKNAFKTCFFPPSHSYNIACPIILYERHGTMRTNDTSIVKSYFQLDSTNATDDPIHYLYTVVPNSVPFGLFFNIFVGLLATRPPKQTWHRVGIIIHNILCTKFTISTHVMWHTLFTVQTIPIQLCPRQNSHNTIPIEYTDYLTM